MALTREDLQSVREIAREEVAEGIAPLKVEISEVKQRLTTLEEKHDGLVREVRSISNSVILLEVTLSDKLQILIEGMNGWQDRNHQIDNLERKTEDHGHRIWALEEAVKSK